MVDEPPNSYERKKKILFVDPDTSSYLLVARLLAGYDTKIIHSGFGPYAIKIFRKNPFIDCVITEIRVPGLDGFEILRAVREINPLVTVIAQTAYVHDNIKQKCQDAGFNEYISKPVDLKLFLCIINKNVLHSV
ncbi:MAG: response regulator [Bacteroidales bacterium]|nr:response regulator [Bacteroidales bacterium]